MTRTGKIGVFDSGLGGLFITQGIRNALPRYDYIYLGDTLNVPYGKRSDKAICDLTEQAMRFLFTQGCELIIMACNTASAAALRTLQQGFLQKEYPERRILGVVIPTLEAAISHGATRIGLVATQRTVQSKIYDIELKKINGDICLTACATPLLVPLIEDGGEHYLDAVLGDYLEPLIAQRIQSLILGCTHYTILKDRIRHLTGNRLDILSQDDILPPKLGDYLARHPEMEKRLSLGGTLRLYATDANDMFTANAKKLCGQEIRLELARYLD